MVVTDPLSYDDSGGSTCYFWEIITQKNAAPPVRISCAVSEEVGHLSPGSEPAWQTIASLEQLYIICNLQHNIEKYCKTDGIDIIFN